jgi:uncharacterized protein YlxW (UPF0749 family)
MIDSQERIIERLKEQRERDDRERLEELESFRKENKDLKEKVNALQAELTEKEVSLEEQSQTHIHHSFERLIGLREPKALYEYLGSLGIFLLEN